MDNLLFTALTITTLYYFFYYLPQEKKLSTQQPILETKQTQTDPFRDEKEKEIIELKNKNQELETELKTKQKDYQSQITKLQTQIRELAKRPLKPTNSKGIQTDPETELTNTLDTLIKDIQQLNNSLN